MKTLYRTQAIAQAGRNGEVHTLDNSLQLALALPTALGGNSKGNNPEQLLAAGYAACFSNALIHVAHKLGVPLSVLPSPPGSSCWRWTMAASTSPSRWTSRSPQPNLNRRRRPSR